MGIGFCFNLKSRSKSLWSQFTAYLKEQRVKDCEKKTFKRGKYLCAAPSTTLFYPSHVVVVACATGSDHQVDIVVVRPSTNQIYTKPFFNNSIVYLFFVCSFTEVDGYIQLLFKIL